jgi:hypothetical protein
MFYEGIQKNAIENGTKYKEQCGEHANNSELIAFGRRIHVPYAHL